MTTRWTVDTCYCVVVYEKPNTNEGVFEKRCSIHKNSTGLLDVWSHNKANQIRYAEHTGTGKDRRPTEAARIRVKQVRDSTDPDRRSRLETQPIKAKATLNKKWWQFWR